MIGQMTKKEFLKQLLAGLKGLPKEEIEYILSDYKEHFAAAKAKKKRETTTVKALGNPKQIAKQHKAEFVFRKAEDKKSLRNILRAVFASISLGFFNLVFAIALFAALFGVVVGFFAAAAGMFFGGLGALLGSVALPMLIPFAFPVLAGIFVGIGLMAFGVLFFIGACYVTKWFYKLTIVYLRFNVRIIKGDKNEN